MGVVAWTLLPWNKKKKQQQKNLKANQYTKMATRFGFYRYADSCISNTDIFLNKYRYLYFLELQISLIEMQISVIQKEIYLTDN